MLFVLHREQAVAIGQALLYAGYVESVGNQMPVFRDDLTLYKPGDVSQFDYHFK